MLSRPSRLEPSWMTAYTLTCLKNGAKAMLNWNFAVRPIPSVTKHGSFDCKVNVTFTNMNTLSINFVLASWVDDANVTHTANIPDANQAQMEIQARLPLFWVDREISSIPLGTNPCNTTPSALLEKIVDKKNQDIANGKAVKTFYMGLIPDQASCGPAYGNNGVARGPGASSLVFTTRNGNPGTPGSSMDGNSRPAGWHELAHNMDVDHTESGSGELEPATDY